MGAFDILALAVPLLIVLGFLVVLFFVLRYWLRCAMSNSWPHTTAIIQRDYVGTVGRGAASGFFRYTFSACGTNYCGRFLIVDNTQHAEMLQKILDGQSISIRYQPKYPHVSLLCNTYDPRFDGPIATQNPYWFCGVRQRDSLLVLNLTKNDR